MPSSHWSASDGRKSPFPFNKEELTIWEKTGGGTRMWVKIHGKPVGSAGVGVSLVKMTDEEFAVKWKEITGEEMPVLKPLKTRKFTDPEGGTWEVL